MSVFESIRKALMAGLGVQESVKELVDELIKKGELSETQGANLVREWSDKVGKSGDNLSKSISELVNNTLEKMNIPSREEVDKIKTKTQALSSRLKKLEEKSKETQ